MSEIISFKKKNIDPNPKKEMSFWQHIEELRWLAMRVIIVVVLLSIIAFLNKEIVFDKILLAPRNADFITYRLLCYLGQWLSIDSLCIQSFDLNIINLSLSGQFMKHMAISMYAGLIVASPYIIWEIWHYIKPALKEKEQKYTVHAVFICSLLFITGILFSYFIIVPLTINFLATYSISPTVVNQISLDSYIGTISSLTFSMGLVFELPVVIYFLSKVGLISATFLREKRKYAIVIVLIAAAIITPGSDAFSLVLVSVPLYVLFEMSIWVIRKV